MSSSNDIYCTFDELIENIDPELGVICKALRTVITKLHPKHLEIVWKNQNIASYGLGPKKMSEHYTYIAPHQKHVNLGFYHGAALPDPDHLLEGTGKRLRHIKIHTVREAKRPQVEQLIRAAIAERERL
jgi:hypothetical protein